MTISKVLRCATVTIAITSSVFLVSGCSSSASVMTFMPDDYLEYQPTDPTPVSTVRAFDAKTGRDTTYYYASLDDSSIRALLPIESSAVYVSKQNDSGGISYVVGSASGSKGIYSVTMDFMKYRVEDIYSSENPDSLIGSGKVGVGLRIRAVFSTSKANLNLGGLLTIGVEASANELSGGIVVDVIGIDSKGVTTLMPLTSQIDQTSIQNALQALATVKSKLWDPDVKLTPHLIAFRQLKKGESKKVKYHYRYR